MRTEENLGEHSWFICNSMEFFLKGKCPHSSFEPDWKGLKTTTEKERSATVLLQQLRNLTVGTIEQLKHCVGNSRRWKCSWNAGLFLHLHYREVTGRTVKHHCFALSFASAGPKKLTRGIWLLKHEPNTSRAIRDRWSTLPTERVNFSEGISLLNCTKD